MKITLSNLADFTTSLKDTEIMCTPTIDCYQSESDGVWVVHVDTKGCPEDTNGPIMRVYINDDTDNPVYSNTPSN